MFPKREYASRPGLCRDVLSVHRNITSVPKMLDFIWQSTLNCGQRDLVFAGTFSPLIGTALAVGSKTLDFIWKSTLKCGQSDLVFAGTFSPLIGTALSVGPLTPSGNRR